MADIFSADERSRVMSLIRSKGNRSTEWRIRARLIKAGVSGWQINVKDIPGKPDFVFYEKKVILFVDGCFWHGCKKCKRTPSSNTNFWLTKINKNRKRDKTVTALLVKSGWQVLRFWEHDIRKNPTTCISTIKNLLLPEP